MDSNELFPSIGRWVQCQAWDLSHLLSEFFHVCRGALLVVFSGGLGLLDRQQPSVVGLGDLHGGARNGLFPQPTILESGISFGCDG
jgi:hypothetical protein